jgi:ABC-type nitrate/sulfonate/bicarbonate transport system permease component
MQQQSTPDPAYSRYLFGADRQFLHVLQEASTISTGTLDFCWILGIGFGWIFGFVLPGVLGGSFDLGSNIVDNVLLDKLASLVVALIISVRVILARSMRDASPIEADGGGHVIGRHMLATAWASTVALFNFLLAALIGYALGLFMGSPNLAKEVLDSLAQNYQLSSLLRVFLRVLAEAVMISWVSFFDMIVLTGSQEALSHTMTRRILMLAVAILGIEILDAYLEYGLS